MLLKPDADVKSASQIKNVLQACVSDENLASKTHEPSVPIITASSKGYSLAAMAKVKFAPGNFKGVNSPIPKILFGRDVASTSNPANFDIGDLRNFSIIKEKKSQVSHCHCKWLINAVLSHYCCVTTITRPSIFSRLTLSPA